MICFVANHKLFARLQGRRIIIFFHLTSAITPDMISFNCLFACLSNTRMELLLQPCDDIIALLLGFRFFQKCDRFSFSSAVRDIDFVPEFILDISFEFAASLHLRWEKKRLA
jgi:hypothetical protein